MPNEAPYTIKSSHGSYRVVNKQGQTKRTFGTYEAAAAYKAKINLKGRKS